MAIEQRALAPHVFSRLQAIYGTRFSQMWRGSDTDEVFATWNRALQAFSLQRIGVALDECTQLERPPDLPAFLAMVRAVRIDSEQPALLAHDPSAAATTREQARANLQRIRQMLTEAMKASDGDYLRWARRPSESTIRQPGEDDDE